MNVWKVFIRFFFFSTISTIQEANHSEIKQSILSDEAITGWTMDLGMRIAVWMNDFRMGRIRLQKYWLWVAINYMISFNSNSFHYHHIERMAFVDKHLMGKYFKLKLKMANEYVRVQRQVLRIRNCIVDCLQFRGVFATNIFTIMQSRQWHLQLILAYPFGSIVEKHLCQN